MTKSSDPEGYSWLAQDDFIASEQEFPDVDYNSDDAINWSELGVSKPEICEPETLDPFENLHFMKSLKRFSLVKIVIQTSLQSKVFMERTNLTN